MFTRRILSVGFSIAAILTLAAQNAQAQTNLAFFNFNDVTGTTTSDAYRALLSSPDGGVNQASATMSFSNLNFSNGSTGGNVGITNFGGTTNNSTPLGGTAAVAGQALTIQGFNTAGANTNNGRYLQFGVPTTGFSNIVVSFSIQRSGTGFNSNQFQFSTDGTNFTDLGTAFNPATSFATQTFDLSGVTAVNNVPDAQFRILLNGATSDAGNIRIDNLQINSVVIPEANAGVLLALALPMITGAVVLRRRK